MSYKDITSQSAQALWGTRMAERDAARVQQLERLHKVTQVMLYKSKQKIQTFLIKDVERNL